MKIYFQRVSEIRKAQNFKEFYSRHFSGKFSPYVAAAFVGTPVTPNHLTALMVPSGIVGGIMLSFGTPLGFTIGSLLFVLLNILDAADGELARYTEQTSEFGDYLDRVAHYMTNTALIMGLGIGLYLQTGHVLLIPLTFLANSAIIGDDAIRDLLVTCGLQGCTTRENTRKSLKSKSKISLGVIGNIVNTITSNLGIFHISAVISLVQFLKPGLNILEPYFIFAAVCTILKFCARVYKIKVLYV